MTTIIPILAFPRVSAGGDPLQAFLSKEAELHPERMRRGGCFCARCSFAITVFGPIKGRPALLLHCDWRSLLYGILLQNISYHPLVYSPECSIYVSQSKALPAVNTMILQV